MEGDMHAIESGIEPSGAVQAILTRAEQRVVRGPGERSIGTAARGVLGRVAVVDKAARRVEENVFAAAITNQGGCLDQGTVFCLVG